LVVVAIQRLGGDECQTLLVVFCCTLQALEKEIKASAGKGSKELDAHEDLHRNPSDGEPANDSASCCVS